MSVPLISVGDAYYKVTSGQALLVCAYESDAKFTLNYLPGALSLNEFSRKLGTISRSREVIFYCA